MKGACVVLSMHMAITSSAKNVRRKRAMSGAIKDARKGMAGKEAVKTLAEAYKAIDKAAKRGVIKKNTAARKKSRLARLAAATKA